MKWLLLLVICIVSCKPRTITQKTQVKNVDPGLIEKLNAEIGNHVAIEVVPLVAGSRVIDSYELGKLVSVDKASSAIILENQNMGKASFSTADFVAALDKTISDPNAILDNTWNTTQYPTPVAVGTSIEFGRVKSYTRLSLLRFYVLNGIKFSQSEEDVTASELSPTQSQNLLLSGPHGVFLPVIKRSEVVAPQNSYPLPKQFWYKLNSNTYINSDDFYFDEAGSSTTTTASELTAMDPIMLSLERHHVLTKDMTTEDVDRMTNQLLANLNAEDQQRAKAALIRDIQRKLTFLLNEIFRFYANNIFDRKGSVSASAEQAQTVINASIAGEAIPEVIAAAPAAVQRYGLTYTREGLSDWPAEMGNYTTNKLLSTAPIDFYTAFTCQNICNNDPENCFFDIQATRNTCEALKSDLVILNKMHGLIRELQWFYACNDQGIDCGVRTSEGLQIAMSLLGVLALEIATPGIPDEAALMVALGAQFQVTRTFFIHYFFRASGWLLGSKRLITAGTGVASLIPGMARLNAFQQALHDTGVIVLNHLDDAAKILKDAATDAVTRAKALTEPLRLKYVALTEKFRKFYNDFEFYDPIPAKDKADVYPDGYPENPSPSYLQYVCPIVELAPGVSGAAATTNPAGPTSGWRNYCRFDGTDFTRLTKFFKHGEDGIQHVLVGEWARRSTDQALRFAGANTDGGLHSWAGIRVRFKERVATDKLDTLINEMYTANGITGGPGNDLNKAIQNHYVTIPGNLTLSGIPVRKSYFPANMSAQEIVNMIEAAADKAIQQGIANGRVRWGARHTIRAKGTDNTVELKFFLVFTEDGTHKLITVIPIVP